MYTVNVRNVSEGLYVGLAGLNAYGEKKPSRAGEMIEMPYPVVTTYTHPCERVLFCPVRNANPFFHFMESLWMLAGRNDVEWLIKFNKRMKEYSNNGTTFEGAYGYRWRNHFNNDQLLQAIHRLRMFENDRRTVVAMWDPDKDAITDNWNKDIPCNTHIYFKVRNGFLHMTVCCRSNDIIWGLYGANAVHFSVLHEYMAARVGVRVGFYHHLSDSYHAYTEIFQKLKDMLPDYDPYLTLGDGKLHYDPMPLVEHPSTFDDELFEFVDGAPRKKWNNGMFPTLAIPMRKAWEAWKGGEKALALQYVDEMHARDWRKACREYIQRNSKS